MTNHSNKSFLLLRFIKWFLCIYGWRDSVRRVPSRVVTMIERSKPLSDECAWCVHARRSKHLTFALTAWVRMYSLIYDAWKYIACREGDALHPSFVFSSSAISWKMYHLHLKAAFFTQNIIASGIMHCERIKVAIAKCELMHMYRKHTRQSATFRHLFYTRILSIRSLFVRNVRISF